MKFKYCILSGGNSFEFPELENELKRRDIRASYCTLKANGRIFAIPAEDFRKLPRDKKGPYLGDDDSGHSIYSLDIEHCRKVWPDMGPWVAIK